MIFTEVKGNLFTAPKHFKFAHCIAADAGMGKGIAVDFVNKFPKIKQLRKQELKVGSCYYIDPVINMVTKRRSPGKPSYDSMCTTIYSLRTIIEENEIKHLAIPKIGCGLDRLSWPAVRNMLFEVLKDVEIEIVTYII